MTSITKNQKKYNIYKLSESGILSASAVSLPQPQETILDASIYGSVHIENIDYWINRELDHIAYVYYCDSKEERTIEYYNKQRDRDNTTAQEKAFQLTQKHERQKTKLKAIKKRRKEFSIKRPQIILKMLENGVEYICAQEGCSEVEFLTIDHVIPLSRGGGDEIENLQFMCRVHNSEKGDR